MCQRNRGGLLAGVGWERGPDHKGFLGNLAVPREMGQAEAEQYRNDSVCAQTGETGAYRSGRSV